MARAPTAGSRRTPRSRRIAGLGPALCWAVVFADLGTSVYYTPGILFNQVGAHAALFVALTLIVFVLLTLKYAEVTVRYPEGGGVVAVGAHAVNGFVGLLGGLFILVDYFLTSSLSAVSGITYLGTVVPSVLILLVPCTIAALVVIGVLNLNGISADAKVTAVIAGVALLSQLAVIVAVVAHSGIGAALGAVPKVVAHPIGGVGLLTGYAGAFLAFSGLESISQLSPAMATPRRRVAPRTMVLVIVTVALTSPLLTLWSTTLLDTAHSDPNQFISLLAGYAAGPLLQTEVALTAALLLVFASNTATIGCYHVFLVLSRMRFLPEFLQRRNRLRDTPHWSIFFATIIPIAIVIASRGSAGVLGDLYAFGLLGAFSVTCICIDIVRWRERRHHARPVTHGADIHLHTSTPAFVLGIVTSFLVVLAWATNLFAKPMATLFGGTVTLLGLAAVGITQVRRRSRGHSGPVPHAERLEQVHLPVDGQGKHPLVVLLHGSAAELDALADAALDAARGTPPVFLFIGSRGHIGPAVHLREIVDPYLTDSAAQEAFRAVQRTAGHRRRHRLVYAAGPHQRSAGVAAALGQLQAGRLLLLEEDAEHLTGLGAAKERSLDHGSTHMQLWLLPSGPAARGPGRGR
jgi:amino acid transporter